MEPYYAAAYAYYQLETRFRARSIPTQYKTARYHIILALRLLIDREPTSQMNSADMGIRAQSFINALWDPTKADALFEQAVHAIDQATGNELERDHVRTLAVRNRLLSQLGREPV